MARRGCTFSGLLPGLVIGVALIVGGFLTDPSAMTDDGYPLKPFMFCMGGGFLVLSLVIAFGYSLARVAKRRKIENLLETGQQGEAVVLSLEDTGTRINDNPRVRMLLEVHLAGRSSYQVEKTMVVPLIRLSQVQVGSTVQVLVDASQPDNADKIELLLR
jgi:hypothetical protein